MNCPKCGYRDRHSPKVTDHLYDPDTQEAYRRCKCSKCGHVFFTIEYEVECSETLARKFYAASNAYKKLESSKKRFYAYRESKKTLQKIRKVK